MAKNYDVIVIGARCAGSPTAMLLARRGYRVLVLDRASFPSDTLSTHVIQPKGVAALARWGLLEAVAATGCPPVLSQTFDFGAFSLRGTPRPLEGNSTVYAPRRTVLDKILVDAAAAAGAEIREHVTIEEVLRSDDGAVIGARSERRAADRTCAGGHRGGWAQFDGRQGNATGGVPHQAPVAALVLQLLGKSSRGRLRDLHPARPRLGRHRHQ
jgi:flavin-dependent dehydrogenase